MLFICKRIIEYHHNLEKSQFLLLLNTLYFPKKNIICDYNFKRKKKFKEHFLLIINISFNFLNERY